MNKNIKIPNTLIKYFKCILLGKMTSEIDEKGNISRKLKYCEKKTKTKKGEVG